MFSISGVHHRHVLSYCRHRAYWSFGLAIRCNYYANRFPLHGFRYYGFVTCHGFLHD
jgi:hypothetical protein